MNLFSIEGKVAVVTGGRRGLGRALVGTLLTAGAKVTVVARSKNDKDLPPEVFYIQANLARREEREGIIDQVIERYGRIDILVNNAAVIDYMPSQEYQAQLWDEVIATNLSAVFELSMQAAARMSKGKIIQLCSVASYSGARNIVGYATTKHGLVGMIKCLSNELMPLGINVNGIAPGIMATEMHQEILSNPYRREEVEGRIPAGRLGVGADLSGALLFLASDASEYVSGTTILVDGGYHGR